MEPPTFSEARPSTDPAYFIVSVVAALCCPAALSGCSGDNPPPVPEDLTCNGGICTPTEPPDTTAGGSEDRPDAGDAACAAGPGATATGRVVLLDDPTFQLDWGASAPQYRGIQPFDGVAEVEVEGECGWATTTTGPGGTFTLEGVRTVGSANYIRVRWLDGDTEAVNTLHRGPLGGFEDFDVPIVTRAALDAALTYLEEPLDLDPEAAQIIASIVHMDSKTPLIGASIVATNGLVAYDDGIAAGATGSLGLGFVFNVAAVEYPGRVTSFVAQRDGVQEVVATTIVARGWVSMVLVGFRF